MINVNEFKPGITFMDGNDIYVVINAQHSKQGRGQANVKAKIKNLRTGATTIKTWTGGDKVSKAHIATTAMNYLYDDGQNIFLMDDETFEQVEISISKVEWEKNFLVEGMKVKIRKFNDEILDIELPANLELKVVNAPDAVKGNTANNPQKKVILETGFEVEVPMFIKENDVIIISTEEGTYKGKGKKE